MILYVMNNLFVSLFLKNGWNFENKLRDHFESTYATHAYTFTFCQKVKVIK